MLEVFNLPEQNFVGELGVVVHLGVWVISYLTRFSQLKQTKTRRAGKYQYISRIDLQI